MTHANVSPLLDAFIPSQNPVTKKDALAQTSEYDLLIVTDASMIDEKAGGVVDGIINVMFAVFFVIVVLTLVISVVDGVV
jgi:hypothetical protein